MMPAVVHHRTPSGWILAALIGLGVLYVAWRTGRLGKLRGVVAGVPRLRNELRALKIRPLTLLPLMVLVIVVVVLLVTR